MVRIFLNYRRMDDPGHAGRLFDRLKVALADGHLFMDVDGSSIRPGDEFADVIEERVAACDILLAVIGPRWLELLRANAGSQQDFVVLEIEAALRYRKRVVPVFVGDAPQLDPAELPESIRDLSRRQSVELRTARFDVDTNDFLDQLLHLRPEHAATPWRQWLVRPTEIAKATGRSSLSEDYATGCGIFRRGVF